MAKNKQTKQFRELSDEDLKKVTGGASVICLEPDGVTQSMATARKNNGIIFIDSESWLKKRNNSQNSPTRNSKT